MIQVCGERVLSGNRMKRKRLSDQRKQEVKVKITFRLNNDFGLHRLKTLAPVHRSKNISKCSYSSMYFLACRLECFLQSWC